jgi:hypothetical protein
VLSNYIKGCRFREREIEDCLELFVLGRVQKPCQSFRTSLVTLEALSGHAEILSLLKLTTNVEAQATAGGRNVKGVISVCESTQRISPETLGKSGTDLFSPVV